MLDFDLLSSAILLEYRALVPIRLSGDSDEPRRSEDFCAVHIAIDGTLSGL